MASAHGAGLMLLPILMAQPIPGMTHTMGGMTAVPSSLSPSAVGLAVLIPHCKHVGRGWNPCDRVFRNLRKGGLAATAAHVAQFRPAVGARVAGGRMHGPVLLKGKFLEQLMGTEFTCSRGEFSENHGLIVGWKFRLLAAKFFGMMVARDGVEPPTPAFSGLYSLSLNPFSINNLIRQDGRFIVTIL